MNRSSSQVRLLVKGTITNVERWSARACLFAVCLLFVACGSSVSRSVDMTPSRGSSSSSVDLSTSSSRGSTPDRVAPVTEPTYAREGSGHGDSFGGAATSPHAPSPPVLMDTSIRAPAADSASVGASVDADVTVNVNVNVVEAEHAVAPIEVRRVPHTILTAAAVSDHDRQDNYRDYLSRHFREANHYGLDMRDRVRIRVLDAAGVPVENAVVRVQSAAGSTTARTHSDGVCDIYGHAGTVADLDIEAANESAQVRVDLRESRSAYVRVELDSRVRDEGNGLDLLFTIDATGSMGDELAYIQAELEHITNAVRRGSQSDIRVGVVFYRDRTDLVPLAHIPFTRNINDVLAVMSRVNASGGGDYPEDMFAGLELALMNFDWRHQANKVIVLVGDAPPQFYRTNFDHQDAIDVAVENGIRILPVAASGADRSTEFLFRAFGAATSTPYVYLTDDSGVGAPHMEADTDRVAVEMFADLLIRLLLSDLSGEGMHEAAGFEQ